MIRYSLMLAAVVIAGMFNPALAQQNEYPKCGKMSFADMAKPMMVVITHHG